MRGLWPISKKNNNKWQSNIYRPKHFQIGFDLVIDVGLYMVFCVLLIQERFNIFSVSCSIPGLMKASVIGFFICENAMNL